MITAIISAYNEEKTVGEVIKTALSCELSSEIIVINDGSTDKTGKEIESLSGNPKLKIINFPKNKGKGYAMSEGIKKAKGEILVFLDADIINLRKSHIESLVLPMARGEAGMVIGHPAESKFDWILNPLKPLAGERAVFKKDVLPLLEKFKTSKFGVEIIMNFHYWSEARRIKFVMLWGLKHPIKFQKEKLAKAVFFYILETHQIILAAAKQSPLIFKGIRRRFL